MGRIRGWALALLLFVLFAVSACGGQTAPQSGAESPPAKENPDRPAANAEARPIAGFRAPELIGRDVANNQPVILSAWQGQVVVLNFWATWCGPCRVEMPELEHLQTELGRRVKVVAVGVDPHETPEKLAEFAQSLGLSFTVVHDGGEAGRDYMVVGVPTTIFIDQNGIIRARYTGAMNLKQMKQYAAEAESLGAK